MNKHSKLFKRYIKEAAHQPASRQSRQFTELVHDAIRTKAALKAQMKRLAQLSKEHRRRAVQQPSK